MSGAELTHSDRKLIKARAREVAEGVLDTYWDDDAFPVDPFKVCREIGIDVYQADLAEDVSGLARRSPGQGSTIYVERNDSMNRQRFTCAHEMGRRP